MAAKRFFSLTFATLVLAFSLAAAQSPATTEPVGHLNPGFVAPPMIPPQAADRLAKHLGLDAGKAAQVKKIQGELGTDLERTKIALERKMLDFRELMLAANLDMEKIKKNCEERGRLVADMQYRMVVSDNEVKKFLTADQWTQYMQIRIQMMNRPAGKVDMPKTSDSKAPEGRKPAGG